MFYISLPYFYENKKFNDFFKDYIQDCPDAIIDKFSIEYCYGAFPWSLWNGGINNHKGEAVLMPEMESVFNTTNSAMRIDCSNYLLQPMDYFDIHENAILKLLSNTGGVCEISDLQLMDYVNNFDKNIRFIISNNAQLTHLFSEEILNAFAEQDNIEFITVNNIEAFNTANLNKKKIELSIGQCLNCSHEQFLTCCQAENNSIYNFSGLSAFHNCAKAIPISNYYLLLKPWYQKGFTHFKIMPPMNLLLEEFNQILITSFIKPEYIGECLIEYSRIK